MGPRRAGKRGGFEGNGRGGFGRAGRGGFGGDVTVVSSIWDLVEHPAFCSFRIHAPGSPEANRLSMENCFVIEPDYCKSRVEGICEGPLRIMCVECDSESYRSAPLQKESILWETLSTMTSRPESASLVTADFRLGKSSLKKEPNGGLVLIGQLSQLQPACDSLVQHWRSATGTVLSAPASDIADDLALALIPVPLVLLHPKSTQELEKCIHMYLKKLLLALETPGHDLSVGEEEYKTRLKNAVTFVKTVIISCERNTIVIPNDKVGSIIGRGGVTVKDLQTRLGVTLQIPSVADVESNPPTRTITINGSPESISQAKKEIVKLLEIRRSGVIAHHLQQLIIQSHQWASVLDIALENSTAATSAASTGSVSDSCDEECMFGLVMVQDDFVETTKAGSTPSGDVKVDLPGGKRHVGECAIDAAVREFTEETGLTLNVKPGGTHSVVFDAFPDSLAISADNSLKGGTFRLFVVKQNPPSPCSQESNTVLTELLEAALILREGER